MRLALALSFLSPLLTGLVLHSVTAFDVDLLWDVPDTAVDITQASANIQLNSTSSPLNTEWIGVGWETGALSLQKLGDNKLVALLQLRAPTNESTVRAGRVTEFSSAHYIDSDHSSARQGMYLQSKIDQDSSESRGYSLKVIAHYNMVANNTIYQGLWSDGEQWTYMGSLVLQHPKTGSIKEEVARALEDAAQLDESTEKSRRVATTAGSDVPAKSAEREPAEPESTVPASRDPLSGTKPPETLATCEINRDSQGRIKPVCKFIRQLPIVPSFPKPFSGLRRTSEGSAKYERAGIFKDLSLKGRLGSVYDITAARCISHNRAEKDVASCQRDPNNPEFYISIDGINNGADVSKNGKLQRIDTEEGDQELVEENSRIHHDASKLPEVNIA
ncbi:hypothetical protein H4R99_000655 [Coemansia sp. RSA 1722]|nr:hypothetical protein IWW45_000538 [Coemansia sp. RSA 485]KAJ2606102.1 hypothetical protein H4R99_000655 [Coemansia sp. RSA 1722]KAJ2638121.1 hypothetical protein GGF40_001877 [Coemansia sp. RSA 1286]